MGHVAAGRPVMTVSLTSGVVEEAVVVSTHRQLCVCMPTEGWMCLVLLNKTVNIVHTSRLLVVVLGHNYPDNYRDRQRSQSSVGTWSVTMNTDEIRRALRRVKKFDGVYTASTRCLIDHAY